MTYSVKLEGAERLIKLLDADALLAKPIKNALKAVGAMGKAEARSRAPRGKTGGLVRTIGYKVSSKPRWVAITSKDPRMIRTPGHGVSSLGRFLEFSPKHGRQGWLMNSMLAVQQRLSGILRTAADEIEATWRRG